MFACVLLHYAFFSICFNPTRRQSDFVLYKQETLGGCDPRPSFQQEPKGAFRHEDFSRITNKYDRGHLVPNADYGCSTFIMGNVVPQLINFNRGSRSQSAEPIASPKLSVPRSQSALLIASPKLSVSWRVLEERLRKTYQGKSIMKGCLYKGRIESGIEIPEGCWWIVFDNNEIQEEGYLDQFSGEELAFLPASIKQSLNAYVQNNTDLYFSGLNPTRPASSPEVQPSSWAGYSLITFALICAALGTFFVLRRDYLRHEVDIPFEYED